VGISGGPTRSASNSVVAVGSTSNKLDGRIPPLSGRRGNWREGMGTCEENGKALDGWAFSLPFGRMLRIPLWTGVTVGAGPHPSKNSLGGPWCVFASASTVLLPLILLMWMNKKRWFDLCCERRCDGPILLSAPDRSEVHAVLRAGAMRTRRYDHRLRVAIIAWLSLRALVYVELLPQVHVRTGGHRQLGVFQRPAALPPMAHRPFVHATLLHHLGQRALRGRALGRLWKSDLAVPRVLQQLQRAVTGARAGETARGKAPTYVVVVHGDGAAKASITSIVGTGKAVHHGMLVALRWRLRIIHVSIAAPVAPHLHRPRGADPVRQICVSDFASFVHAGIYVLLLLLKRYSAILIRYSAICTIRLCHVHSR
jgi:hypothetical protein